MAVDLAQFKRRLVYEDQASATGIADSIDQIRQFDRRMERRRLAMGWTIGLSFGAGLLCGVTGNVPMAVLFGIVFLAAIMARYMTRKSDLPNRRYELLQVLTNLLSRDMPKDAPFTVSLDLAPPDETHKHVGEGTVRDWKVNYYIDPWLRLKGRLADGTSFQIAMVERHQARSKWARSRSGKRKHKSKTKSATVASVGLFPKQKRYANVARVKDQALGLVRLPNWARVKRVVADADALQVTAVTTAAWSVRRNDREIEHDGSELVVRMLLSLYQVLHTSKALPAA